MNQVHQIKYIKSSTSNQIKYIKSNQVHQIKSSTSNQVYQIKYIKTSTLNLVHANKYMQTSTALFAVEKVVLQMKLYSSTCMYHHLSPEAYASSKLNLT